MSVFVSPVAVSAATGVRVARIRTSGRTASVLLGVCVLLAMIVAAGAALGYRGQVVLSGSMRPALEPGDMIVAHRMPASEIRIGQVISFAAPGDSRTLTHRVTKVRELPSGMIAVTTRGDANNVSERWKIAPTGTVGEVTASVPRLGLATRWAAEPSSRLAVFALIGLLLAGLGLRWVWRD
jgi:signal peptidase I